MSALASKESLDIHVQTRRMIYLAAMAVYSSREVSAQEATWSLRGYPFYFLSTSVIDVNLLPAHKFMRKLKSRSDLSQLPQNSTDIFASDYTIDKKLSDYMSITSSSEQMAEISFYEFAVWFTENKSKKSQVFAV